MKGVLGTGQKEDHDKEISQRSRVQAISVTSVKMYPFSVHLYVQLTLSVPLWPSPVRTIGLSLSLPSNLAHEDVDSSFTGCGLQRGSSTTSVGQISWVEHTRLKIRLPREPISDWSCSSPRSDSLL